jgi:dihydrofolate synthase/folylpolyglutamate synthase
MQIAGVPVDPGTFARLTRTALAAADRVPKRLGPPTEFELLTAMVFAWFAEEAVDLAIVEVGLGGRLDATHAWDGGVAAITNVDLDHTDRLGPTIAHIAREKAAIIERGDLAVTGATGEARAIIRRRASRVGAPLTVVDPALVVGLSRDAIEVELPGLGRTAIGLRGRHQAANAAIAHAVLDALAEAGIARVTDAHRRAGYATARWPGRLELLSIGGADVLLDGAHNPAGAEALAAALDDLQPFLAPGPATIVTASMADKDVGGIVRALAGAKALHGGRVVATQLDVPRALPAADLGRLWAAAASEPRWQVATDADALAAIERAIATADGPVIIAGSLYLVGLARSHLVDDPLLRDPQPDAAAMSAATR